MGLLDDVVGTGWHLVAVATGSRAAAAWFESVGGASSASDGVEDLEG